MESARISGSSGELSASGTVGVTGAMPVDLEVSMEDFRAIQTDAYRAVVSGPIHVGGMVAAPVLEGSVR
ncbi:MAG: hypothetical protein GWO00_20835, partial [Gemmatimonadetes bacterium]|nr:hypothetical protein [Actinomycetota bacterium]NIR80711.1 hypothetical protein [Gemmatimonadota bacterium]NIT89515.1 hypothetical protein [Gemmatimonadota bacterium]NIU33309.1 hypothetical protein [Gemmatimonadota bacterium]NIV63644.1 hypothetical protein [Gemmatimonadota bacterium]